VAAPVARLGRLAVLALLLGAALAGCSDAGQPLPPEWKGRDLRQPGWANATLQAGWTLGVEYVWSSGQPVQWDWLTEGKPVLYFQVMRMENGQGQTLVGQHRDNSTGRITVPVGGQHEVLFRNEGFAEAKLWYKLPEGGILRMYPPGQGPGCFFLLDGPRAEAC
jgi:hypothetical protein